MRVIHRLCCVVAALAGVPTLVGSATAAPARTVWSTYMRAGPGDTYAVIDEVEHDETVDIRDCRGKWCQVQYGRAIGYIDRDALHGSFEKQPAMATQGPEGCFWSQIPAYLAPKNVRYCGAAR